MIKSLDGVVTKNADQQETYTETQIKKFLKCADPVDGFLYFIEQFVKYVNPATGVQNLRLCDFQKDLLKNIHNEKISVNMLPRQMGKTLCAAAYIAWRLLFLEHENIVIASHRLMASEQILETVRLIIERCPSMLNPGFSVSNKRSLILTNGSKLLAKTLEPDNLRGMSISFLFVDEAGVMSEHKMHEFLSSAYPSIVGSRGKIAFTSTPGEKDSGFNLLWQNAQNKNSGFAKFKAEWFDHPERDEQWKDTIVNQVGEEVFRKEYECEI
jgi:phage terminase large subunit-like protein